MYLSTSSPVVFWAIVSYLSFLQEIDVESSNLGVIEYCTSIIISAYLSRGPSTAQYSYWTLSSRVEILLSQESFTPSFFLGNGYS